MSFKIENIDRAIEWAIRDQAIEKGYWPDERTFIDNDDKAGFNAAINALADRVDVFGSANYKDREQTLKNKIIINRTSIMNGSQTFPFPYDFVFNPLTKDYSKIFTGDGTHNILYEIRFICDDIVMDRVLNMILIESLGRLKSLHGMNDDLTNMTEIFMLQREGNPINVSGNTKIERVFLFIVLDVILDEDKIVKANVPMIKEMTTINNIDQDNPPDVRNPKDHYNVTSNTIGPSDYFIGELQAVSAWNKFNVVRLYANNTQANALKNLKRLSAPSAVNSGLAFTAYEGFTKTLAVQYLDTLINAQSEDFGLTDFCYSVFVSKIPTSGLMELFGLVDSVNNFSFLLTSDSVNGTKAKGNSNNQLTLATFKVQAGKLYTLNSRDRFQMEVWESDVLIGVLQLEPAGKPVGKISELNIFDQTGVAIGTSVAGALSFSSFGKGLRSSEIVELNQIVVEYMTRIGVIS